jgi:type IV pilus assembly protein PilO
MKFGLREMVFIVLLMAIPLSAWWFVFKPRDAHNVEAARQIEAKRAKLRQLNRATATLGDLKGEITDLEEAIGYFRSKLPHEKEIEKVLREIWTLAQANDMQATSIKPSPNEGNTFGGEGKYSEQLIAVQLKGSFMGLYAFLQDLENQPRITRILDMTISRVRGNDSDNPVVTAKFTMTVFFEKAK